jgi:hypothetical protein
LGRPDGHTRVMVRATMAFIRNVGVIISYKWVKSCPSSHRLCSETHYSSMPITGIIELWYVVHIIGALVFFRRVPVIWRVLRPLQVVKLVCFYRLWWKGEMLDRHKRQWHLEGRNLHEIVVGRDITRHCWSWGMQKSKEDDIEPSLARSKIIF